MQRLPQGFAFGDAVATQPVGELAVVGQLLLQVLQSSAPRLRFGAFLLRLLQALLPVTPLLFERRQGVQLFLLRLRRHFEAFTQFGELLLLAKQLVIVRSGQRFGVARQAFAATGHRLQRALRVAAVGLLDVQTLFAVRDRLPLPADGLLRLRMGFLGKRQTRLTGFQSRLTLFDTMVAQGLQFLPALRISRQFQRLRLPLCLLAGELRRTRLEFTPRLAAMADFGLEPGDFGVDRK